MHIADIKIVNTYNWKPGNNTVRSKALVTFQHIIGLSPVNFSFIDSIMDAHSLITKACRLMER